MGDVLNIPNERLPTIDFDSQRLNESSLYTTSIYTWLA